MSRPSASLAPLAALGLSVFVASPAFAEDAIKDETYNMPDAVVATMGVDAAMAKMETAAKPEVVEAFKKAHPAPFWFFGEDRQLAVRNNIIPAHWFEHGAKQFGKFSGVARPGEFYVFQVCVVGGEKPLQYIAPQIRLASLPGAEAKMISRQTFLRAGETTPLWVGVQIPRDAKPGEYAGTVKLLPERGTLVLSGGGAYHGTTTVTAGTLPIGGGNTYTGMTTVGVTAEDRAAGTLAFSIKVEGEPVVESGTGDAWRLARLKWLDSQIGESDTQVTHPFTAIRTDESARTLDILGRRIELGANGIPAQFTSFFSESNTRILPEGRKAFASAPKLEVVVGGKVLPFESKSFQFTRTTPVGVEWIAENLAWDLRLTVTGRLEYDGNLQLRMHLRSTRPEVTVDDVRLVVPFADGVAKYAMGLGKQGGLAPEKLDWKWDVSKNQDSVWLGDTNIGAMLRFKGGNYRRPLINAYYAFQPLRLPDSWGSGGVRLEKGVFTAYSGAKKVYTESKMGNGMHFDLDWYFTPFKPLATKTHFEDRYYHAKQLASVEDTKKLRAEGATILEVHHNRLVNPYINYPFNDDSFGRMKDFITQAHKDDMRVSVYYTTRELTQNLPEFFALKSLDGEVILKRKEGVAWPVTNGSGPHPWLKQHVGLDIVPAWRENLKYPEYPSKLDLAVITTPDSRWNNFYLEGLDYLVKKASIDGLYIDDTALDRKSMQRARRILDADGNTGRRINMHSWNHFNGLAAWTNSSVAFMELYPYYDGLWHGESFSAHSSPEFMLVEMSGIPYGLMSEMLDHPHAWHGMVFGMRTRWPWSGDPRAQWKMEKDFGIESAEFIGWWDSANPVKTGNPKVKASVFKNKGRTLIALASWDDKATKVKLDIDLKALGLDGAKLVALRAPEVAKLQKEAAYAAGDEIPLTENGGAFLIVE